jgi:ubiquinone/menaquinone biosynthesis C-methylase UbiE
MHRSTAIVNRYSALAQRYEQRWQSYLQSTLGAALEALELRGQECLLDIGCGSGMFTRLVHRQFPHITTVGIDLTPSMIALAHQQRSDGARSMFCIGEAERLPLVSGRFDVVVCVNALHHVVDSDLLLHECQRVLVDGGQLAVIDWCRDFWHCRLAHYWWKCTDRTYMTMYRLQELTQLLHSTALRIHGAHRFMASPYYGMMCVRAEKER